MTITELTADPHPVLARLRETEPVSWVPVLDGWLVTGYSLAQQVMRDAATFTVDDPRFSTATVVGPSMLSLDGPEHARHRDPFVPPFRPAPVRDRSRASSRRLWADCSMSWRRQATSSCARTSPARSPSR
jgi:cytochrome P450